MGVKRINFARTGPEGSFSRLVDSRVSLLLTRISNFLTERGVESYVIGGLVRDVLLERETADIDIAAASDALEIADGVAAALGGKYVLLDKVNGVGRVVLIDNIIDS